MEVKVKEKEKWLVGENRTDLQLKLVQKYLEVKNTKILYNQMLYIGKEKKDVVYFNSASDPPEIIIRENNNTYIPIPFPKGSTLEYLIQKLTDESQKQNFSFTFLNEIVYLNPKKSKVILLKKGNFWELKEWREKSIILETKIQPSEILQLLPSYEDFELSFIEKIYSYTGIWIPSLRCEENYLDRRWERWGYPGSYLVDNLIFNYSLENGHVELRIKDLKTGKRYIFNEGLYPQEAYLRSGKLYIKYEGWENTKEIWPSFL